MSVKESITAAIGAHGMWKTKLRTAIDSGSCEIPVQRIRDAQRCAFGAWLHGPARSANIKEWDDYHKCVELHQKFHDAAADVAALAVAGQKREANEAMSTAGPFGKLSGELTRAMQAWLSREDR